MSDEWQKGYRGADSPLRNVFATGQELAGQQQGDRDAQSKPLTYASGQLNALLIIATMFFGVGIVVALVALANATLLVMLRRFGFPSRRFPFSRLFWAAFYSIIPMGFGVLALLLPSWPLAMPLTALAVGAVVHVWAVSKVFDGRRWLGAALVTAFDILFYILVVWLTLTTFAPSNI